MKPIRCTCVRERKENIAQDAAMLLFGARQYISALKKAPYETDWRSYEEALERLERVIAALPELIEAVECAVDVIPESALFSSAYKSAYRSVVRSMATHKAYPLLRDRKGKPVEQEPRCEGCINPRCKRSFS